MALHAGYLHHDAHGVTGSAVNELFRLLQAPALKARLADDDNDFALIISDHLHHAACGYRLLNPGLFEPVTVEVKETRTQAWMWLPPGP
jgi:hypothetical protein